ncbi:hypothetical protein WDV93_19445 [Pantoea ananatis]
MSTEEFKRSNKGFAGQKREVRQRLQKRMFSGWCAEELEHPLSANAAPPGGYFAFAQQRRCLVGFSSVDTLMPKKK